MGFPKLECLLESLRNAKDQNTPFQSRGPKKGVKTPERRRTQLCTNYGFPICIMCEGRKRHRSPIMDFLYAYCRAGKGTRVQLWIFCMHIVRELEKALGSIYGFSICILCESH